MSRPTELSVLMPVHNGERHLRAAIESILNQSFGAFEFVIVDDGSTDASPEILDEYARRDRRIQVITLSQRAGVAGALNAGLERINGALVARMDADDVAYPDRFAIQLDELRRDPTLGLVGTQIRRVDESGRPVAHFDWLLPTTHDRCAWQLPFGAPFCHPSVIMRADVVRGLRGYDQRFPNEDTELWTRMVFVTKMRNIDVELLDYRLGPDDAQKRESWRVHAREVGRLYVERILGRPVSEATIRVMQHHRSTGEIDPTASDLEALAASSLQRNVLERMITLGLVDGGEEIRGLLAEDCQSREAAVLARAADHA